MNQYGLSVNAYQIIMVPCGLSVKMYARSVKTYGLSVKRYGLSIN